VRWLFLKKRVILGIFYPNANEKGSIGLLSYRRFCIRPVQGTAPFWEKREKGWIVRIRVKNPQKGAENASPSDATRFERAPA